MKRKHMIMLLAVVYLSSFASGLPTGAFASGWPDKMAYMGLLVEQASILLVANTVMYAFTSSQLSKLSRFLKLERMNAIGIAIMAVSLVGIAIAPNFTVIVTAAALAGLGSGMVDASLNAYMAKFFSSARYLNWLNAFWGLGPTIGPIIMVQMIALSGWRMGYFALAGVVGVSAVIVFVSLRMGLCAQEGLMQDKAAEADRGKRYLTKARHQFMEVSLFFIYGGMETSMGFWLATVLVEARGMATTTAGMFTALFYGATMVGRMIFGYAANRVKDITMVRFGIGLAVVGLVVLLWTDSVLGAILVGLGFAPIFPCLIHDTANRFNPKILTRMVGHEVAAYGAGAAILSSLKGPVLAYISLEVLFPILLGMTGLVFLINEILERSAKRNRA